MNTKFLLPAAALVAALAAFTWPASATNEAVPAPAFTLASREGGQVSLADLKGQVVMINFWASWCGPCRKEFPALDQIYATKFYEAAPNITLTNHLQQVFTIGVNLAKFNSLTKAQQDIIQAAAVESGEYYQKLVNEKYQSERPKMLAAGATISNVDVKPFQQMLAPVIADAEATGFWSKGLYQRVQDLK